MTDAREAADALVLTHHMTELGAHVDRVTELAEGATS